jgi:hypothetical protein
MWAALPKYPAKGIMRLAMVAGLCLFALSGLSSQSVAQCFLPAGVEGEITYNSAYKVPQYCDNTNWIAMVGAEPPAAAAPYTINAVEFDGTNDYLSQGGLTFPTGQKTASGSMWVRKNVTGDMFLVFNDSYRFGVWLPGDGRFQLTASNSNPTGILDCSSNDVALNDTDWHHVLWSFDLANSSNIHMYVDDVDIGTVGCFVYTDDTYTMPGNVDINRDAGGGHYDGDIADLWIDFGTYIDFSIASNRELFYNNGSPVDLGSDGSTPTGSAPEIFFSGATDSWHTNKGTVGGFSENGALTTASTAPVAASSGEITEIVSNGLIGHWRFDEVTGTTAADSMGSYDLSYSGPGPCTNALNTREGVLDQSLFLDSNQCSLAATFPAGQLDAMPSFSVGGWIKIRSVNGIYDHFFAKSHSVSPFVSWAIEADIGGAGTISFSVGDSGGSAPDARWDGPYEYDRWYHIFGVKDGGTLLIYVDGELEDTTAFGGTIVQENNSVSLTNGWNERADFTADDYRFYNRALSIDEVQDIYNAREGIRYNESARTPEFFDGNRMLAMVSDPPDVTSGLTGHWKLDETSGTSIVDSSGNGHTGVFNNANTEDYVRGAVMNALRFDGVNNEVQVSDHADLELTTNFTASVWFKLDADNTAQQKILFKEHSVEPFISWEISINASRDVMFLLSNTASNSGTPTSYFYVGSNPISVGQWYHAVAVKNGGDLTFYINGAEDEWYNNGPYTGTIIASDSDFLIGAGGGTSAVFQGEIDDARIYQRALSSAEVQKLYNMGTPAGSSTALPQGCPAVGDVCDDGTVYAGTSPDGGVAMFAAPEDAPSDYAWNDDTAATATTTATDFDTGADNTNTIVIVDADGGTGGFQQHEAAQYCYDLVSNGADDWYLPADNELLLLHNGGNQIADVSTGWQYWSSTEMSNSTARTRDMGNGNPANRSKSTNIKTRCVRKGPAPRCASPYGLEGAMLYNDDNNVVQYCDGARWLAIGKDQ